MSTITTSLPSIRRASPDDLDLTAALLADAFQDDPVFAWCVPDPGRRRRVLPAFFRLVGGTVARYDEIFLAGDGAAMWVPPGEPAVPEPAAEAFETGLVELFGADAERTFEVVALLEEHHPHADHHYLWFLGVAARQQGRGVGSHLLAHVLATADRTGTPAYLEATSEHNRRLYERHGFEVVGELATSGSPPLWAMWRQPAPEPARH